MVTVGDRSVRVGALPSSPTLSAHSGANQGTQVVVTASASEVRDRQRDAWLLIAGLVLTGTGAAAGLAVVQARRLTRPIDRLVETSAQLGSGDFSARTGPLDVPELDRVGQSLDDSAARIATLVGRQREFAANVSHQLRSPLTGLQLRLDVLATEGENPETRAREIEAAQEVTDRLGRTVNDLLTLARKGSAGTPENIDLAALASEHARRWEPQFHQVARQIRLDARNPVVARVTPGGVAQALDVLIENALRHGKGTVSITAGSDQVGAFLSVSDEGEGIDPEDRETIFEREASGTGSTGLGLSLARALVEADGGRLLLAGTRPPLFEIRMPAQPGPGSPD